MTLRRVWPVLLLAAVLGVAHLLATPAFWPVDETSHVAYADHLMSTGTVPHIEAPIPRDLAYPGLADRLWWERHELRLGRQDIWTSNHPPVAYLAQGVGLRVGEAIGGGAGAIVAARLTTVAWMVAGVWATMQLAFLLTPTATRDRRRMTPSEVAYAAGTFVALTPTLSHLAGLVFNDVPAFTMSTLCLYAGARVALGGVGGRRLAWLAVACGVAAATRVSCLPAVGIGLALGAYAWWRDGSSMPAKEVGRTVAVAAVAFMPATWFWVRNATLYGDVTASAWLLDKFNRDLNTPVDQLVDSREFWLRLWNRALGDLTTGHWAVGARSDITEGLLLVVLIGVAWWVGRHAVRLWRHGVPAAPAAAADADAGGGREGEGAATGRSGRVRAALVTHPQRVVWVACAALPVALVVSAMQFHAAGGSLHGRYVLGAHAVTATAVVLALDGLPRVGRYLAIASALPLFVVNVSLVQALMLHHDRTWTRSDVDLVLPHLAGDVTGTLTVACSIVAAVLLTIVLSQHRRARHLPGEGRRGGRYGVAPPIRSSRESAAL